MRHGDRRPYQRGKPAKQQHDAKYRESFHHSPQPAVEHLSCRAISRLIHGMRGTLRGIVTVGLYTTACRAYREARRWMPVRALQRWHTRCFVIGDCVVGGHRHDRTRCADADARRLSTIARRAMLWTLFVVLLVLWFLGVVSSYTLGGFIHLLLVLALIAVVLQLIQGRRVV